jgi:hypothetical protein
MRWPDSLCTSRRTNPAKPTPPAFEGSPRISSTLPLLLRDAPGVYEPLPSRAQ